MPSALLHPLRLRGKAVIDPDVLNVWSVPLSMDVVPIRDYLSVEYVKLIYHIDKSDE